MPRPPIPEREPICDTFAGMVIAVAERQALTRKALPDVEVIASGELIVRYGVRYLGKPHLSIVPGLVALDYGEMLVGEAAWEFLLKRSNLHPRADVVGYRNDGRDDMIVVKNLDLAESIAVLVYADRDATVPIAQPAALIETDISGIPARLVDHLSLFPGVSDWQATFDE